jgi:hypothetical protein
VRPANNSHRSLKIFPRNTKGIVPVSLSPRVTSFHSAGFLFLLVPGCRLHGRITELLSCRPPESKGCLALTFSAKLPQAGRRRERERKKAAPCIRRVRSRLFLGAEVLLRRDGNSDWAYSTSVLSGDKGAGVISPGQGVLRGVSPYNSPLLITLPPGPPLFRIPVLRITASNSWIDTDKDIFFIFIAHLSCIIVFLLATFDHQLVIIMSSGQGTYRDKGTADFPRFLRLCWNENVRN